jgi:hypothetical protein
LEERKMEIKLIKAKIKISVVVSIALLISFISIFLSPKFVKSQESYTEITGCTQITSPGEYRLTQDITNSNVSHCIDIQADNVILDCQGHTIDSGNPDIGPDSVGIYTNGYSGITIKNCYLNNWFEGVRIENSNSDTLTSIHGATSSDIVHLFNSSSNTISDVVVVGGGMSPVYLESSANNIISDIDCGIFLLYSNSNSISNVNGIVAISYSSYNDISYVNGEVSLYSSDNNILSNINVYGFYGFWRGINMEYSNYNKISNAQITGCGDFGIYMH